MADRELNQAGGFHGVPGMYAPDHVRAVSDYSLHAL